MPEEPRVYLDHHILRENLRYQRPKDQLSDKAQSRQQNLRLVDLTRGDSHLFTNYLRKPDFQRATWAWTPEECTSLIESIAHYQVVPSIIMWKSPDNNLYYILDGGHRISVVMAWLLDDWGEKEAVNIIDPEQARQVREASISASTLVNSRVGSFEDFRHAEKQLTELLRLNQPDIRTTMGDRNFERAMFMRDLLQGDVSFHILWVDGDYDIAERSFLKINKSGKDLSEWEIRLVDNRNSSFARAVMSISSPNSAEHYWPALTNTGDDVRSMTSEILNDLSKVQQRLFYPSYIRPISRLRQPLMVANSEKRPFYVAEFLTITEAAVGRSGSTDELIREDRDASTEGIVKNGQRLANNARSMLDHLISKTNYSLEIIPLLYFYKSDGTYIRSLFYGFLHWLTQGGQDITKDRKQVFCAYRGQFEAILRRDKDFLVQRLGRNIGSGPEVTGPTAQYFDKLMRLIEEYGGEIELDGFLREYARIIEPNDPKPANVVRSRLFTPKQKSTAQWEVLIESLPICGICGGKIDPEGTVQHDHVIPVKDGGQTSADNQRITHPFCNINRTQIEGIREQKTGKRLPVFAAQFGQMQPYQLTFINDTLFD